MATLTECEAKLRQKFEQTVNTVLIQEEGVFKEDEPQEQQE